MQEKTKNVLLVVLIVGLVSMTVAYAALTQTLTIKSSAKVAASKWDIEFDNLQNVPVATGTGGATNTAEVVTQPEINSKTTIQGLSVKFKQPGDTVRYTFDVVNKGDIDAKLGNFTLGTTDNADVTYSLTCKDIAMVNPYTYNAAFDLTKKVDDTEQKYSCTWDITYKNTVTEMPANETTVTITDTTFNYVQK